jgi:sugar phosphate permease
MARNGVRREPGQVAATLVAVLFVLAGVFDVGPGVLNNLVHLGFGIAGLGLSRGPRGVQAYLIGGGVAYVLLWQFGTVAEPGIVPFHTDEVAVHVALVVTMIGLAMLSGGRTQQEQAAEVEFRVAPARYVRLRSVPSRPPGRGDRSTPTRVADVPRPLSVLACRV